MDGASGWLSNGMKKTGMPTYQLDTYQTRSDSSSQRPSCVDGLLKVSRLWSLACACLMSHTCDCAQSAYCQKRLELDNLR